MSTAILKMLKNQAKFENEEPFYLFAFALIGQLLIYNFVLAIVLLLLAVLDNVKYFSDVLKTENINSESINTASKFFMVICDALNQISKCFSLFSITVLVIQSRAEILFVYGVYVFAREPTIPHFGFILLNASSLLLLWPAFIITIYISTRIRQEGRLMLETMQENLQFSKKNLKRLEIFCQQFYHQPPVVSLSNFNIDMIFAFIYACELFNSSIFFSQFYDFLN